MYKLLFLNCFVLILAMSCQPTTPPAQIKHYETPTLTDTARLKVCPPIPDSAISPDAAIVGYAYEQGHIMLDVRDFKLGIKTLGTEQRGFPNNSKGQYVHIVLNDSLHYTSNYRNYEVAIPDGEYKFVSFLVRSYHESVKNGKAVWARKMSVRGGRLATSNPLDEPCVVAGMPMGEYPLSETNKLMLDFYLVNTEIAPDGNKVRLTINQQAPILLDTWQGYYLEGLGVGEHRLKLELLDRTGRIVQKPVYQLFKIVEG